MIYEKNSHWFLEIHLFTEQIFGTAQALCIVQGKQGNKIGPCSQGSGPVRRRLIR